MFHFPYCDEYEVAAGSIGVLATLPLSVHFARIVANWGPVTLFTDGAISVESSEVERLARRGIRIEERRVAAPDGLSESELRGVRLADGTLVGVRAPFIAT